MQQRMRRFAFFVSGALLVGGGLFVVACGTDNGTTGTTPLPTPDGGGRDGNTTDPIDDDSGNPGEDDAATDPDCSRAARLRENKGTFYCPFRQGDGGPYCTDDESCCNPNRGDDNQFPPSFCADGKDDDACQVQAGDNDSDWSKGGSQWECADTTNCPGTQVCCMFTREGAPQNVNFGPPPASAGIPRECKALNAYQFGGTRCQDSCAAGTEVRLCSKGDDHCQSPTECTPFFALNRDLAYCR